jgi:hypothetical protein
MDQQTLDGDTVPVQRDEKTTTTITWKSDFFKISLKSKDYENLITGATGEDSESFIMKRMKMHKGFPVGNAGKVFKEELKKLKNAIMEGQEEVEKLGEKEEPEELGETKDRETDQDEKADGTGKGQGETEETKPGEHPPVDEDAQMTALITNLITEDRGEELEDYLVMNFKPAVIFKLAEKLHVKVKKNELPQKTAFNIAVKIKALKEKPGASR